MMRINKVLFMQIVGLLIFNLVSSNHLFAQEKISVVTKSEKKEFVNNASERLIERYVFKEIGEKREICHNTGCKDSQGFG